MIFGNVSADNVLSVSDAVIPTGGKAALEINCDFDTLFKGYQLDIELDEGIVLELDDTGNPIVENGFSTDHVLSSNKISENKYRFIALSFTGQPLGQNGTVLRVYVKAEDGVAIGSSFAGKITAIEFTTDDLQPYYFDEIPFSLTVDEPADTKIVLDEESDVLPEPASGVDVRVKRTIKSNTWSTIVLPFDMTNEQLRTAFGDDFELAEFSGWKTTSVDANEEPSSISVNFSETNVIEANIPYLIKVSSEISEFVVNGIDILPEEEPGVTVGKITKGTFGSFTGSYVPMVIDEECLFLNDNKFWYSTGLTKMKGFRAFFYFQDILGSYESRQEAPVRIHIMHNDGTISCINAINHDIQTQDAFYTLSGIKAGNSVNGLVIRDGKKYYIK